MKRENVVVLKGSNWLRVHDVTQLGLWNRQKTKTRKVFFSWEKKSKTLIARLLKWRWSSLLQDVIFLLLLLVFLYLWVCLFLSFFGQCFSAAKCRICGGLTHLMNAAPAAPLDVCCCVVKSWWCWLSKGTSIGLQHRDICTHAQNFHTKLKTTLGKGV